MHILLVHNPDAGDEKPTGAIVAAFTAAGHQVDDITLDGDRWQRALDTPADAIVAAGGDGTARTVAIALAKRPDLRMPLVIAPEGTANNIARSLGMPEDIHDLARCLHDARPSRLSIGVARAAWGTTHFVESAGVGVFATMLRKRRIHEEQSKDAKIAAGVQRLAELLEKARPLEVRIRADQDDLSGSYLMAQAMNILSAGSRVELAPDAHHADTSLDLVLVGEAERPALLDYLAGLADGRDVESPLASRRARRITMSWPGKSGHIDDHAWPKDGESGGPDVELEIATAIPVLIPC